MDEILKRIENLNLAKIYKKVALKKLTTYRCGGVAKCVIYPKNKFIRKVFIGSI